MATSLDMSLDDMIKSSRSNTGRVRGRGRGRARGGPGRGGSFVRGRMAGAVRRGPLNVNTRPSPYTIAKSTRRVKSFPWQHALFEDSIRASGIQGIEIGTKIYISNLDSGVTTDDIRELFAEIGDLKRYSVHYNKTGRPNGSAEVVYTRRSDAFAALKRYNNVLLDGRPMKIEIVGDNSELPISARVNVTGVNGRRRRTVVMTNSFYPCSPGGGPNISSINRGPAFNRGSGPRSRGGLNKTRGGGRNRGGRGRGRGKKLVEKSEADLDKELESYHAMSIS